MDIVSSNDIVSEEPDDSGWTSMELLRAGVPLSLLIDLALPEGPDSHDLFLHETKPDSVWHRPARPA
jgi:hypothetical protein